MWDLQLEVKVDSVICMQCGNKIHKIHAYVKMVNKRFQEILIAGSVNAILERQWSRNKICNEAETLTVDPSNFTETFLDFSFSTSWVSISSPISCILVLTVSLLSGINISIDHFQNFLRNVDSDGLINSSLIA